MGFFVAPIDPRSKHCGIKSVTDTSCHNNAGFKRKASGDMEVIYYTILWNLSQYYCTNNFYGQTFCLISFSINSSGCLYIIGLIESNYEINKFKKGFEATFILSLRYKFIKKYKMGQVKSEEACICMLWTKWLTWHIKCPHGLKNAQYGVEQLKPSFVNVIFISTVESIIKIK